MTILSTQASNSGHWWVHCFVNFQMRKDCIDQMLIAQSQRSILSFKLIIFPYEKSHLQTLKDCCTDQDWEPQVVHFVV